VFNNYTSIASSCNLKSIAFLLLFAAFILLLFTDIYWRIIANTIYLPALISADIYIGKPIYWSSFIC